MTIQTWHLDRSLRPFRTDEKVPRFTSEKLALDLLYKRINELRDAEDVTHISLCRDNGDIIETHIV